MKTTVPMLSDVAVRGERIYQEKLRSLLEPAHKGKIAVINIETGEYELDSEHIVAIKRARARWPEGVFFSVRVGFETIAHIGSRFRSKAE
ncbi:MAG TPA: hypothetical protein VHM90_03365 [Phycisphaerae bacterium]|nr:hypothetical protein [Phycisphaerae bacterium]